MRRKKGCGAATPKLPRRLWAGMTHLQTVRRLNRGCLALLAQSKHGAGAAMGDSDLDLQAWAGADLRVLARAAGCPVLLLDLNFQRIEWWGQAVRGSISSRAPTASAPWFAIEQARPLVQEILTEAWSIGRSMPRAANLIFGMAPPVGVSIAALAASEIDRIALECVPQLRPRWLDRPTFWTNLLRAARGSDDQALANVHLHMLQLFGSELLFRFA